MNRMKGFLTIILFLSICVFFPHKHASANLILIGSSGGTLVFSPAGMINLASMIGIQCLPNNQCGDKKYWKNSLIALGIIIVLDKETSTVKFSPMSDEVAKYLNISVREQEFYNLELDQINLAYEDAVLESNKEEYFKSQISIESLSVIKKLIRPLH